MLYFRYNKRKGDKKRMRPTGIVKRCDVLGRIIIPKEVRQTLGIADGDPMEIFVNDDEIILKKVQIKSTNPCH